MLLNDLVATSELVTQAAGRLEKIRHMAGCLQRLAPAEVAIAVSYLSGVLRQRRLGIGVAKLYQRRHQPAQDPSLSLDEVDRAFGEIASSSGAGSGKRREALLSGLFGRATVAEQDFLVRLVAGELRQGALEGVMAEAIAKAAALPVGQVRRAAMLRGDMAAVAEVALSDGAAGLQQFSVVLFQPVSPMLAQPALDLDDALKRLGEASLEWKLDGARVQLHKKGDQVRVFSRSLNEVTEAVPELVEQARGFEVDSIILDGEAIALRQDGSPNPFQITMSRFGRKLDVANQRRQLPLSPFFFDCLYLDGQPLIDLPQRERFDRMSAVLPSELLVPRLATSDAEMAAGFLAQALGRGHEGVMAKSLVSPYEAGRRGSGWLKVKPVQTLDLVVLAAEWGHGRRRGYLSNLHLGARDPEAGGYVMLGKTFKGMTDRMLAWQTARLLELEDRRDAWTVYVRPELLVEVAFSDIQASPRYPGGFALRFARVKRYRPDKEPVDADTVASVRELYRLQQKGNPEGQAHDG